GEAGRVGAADLNGDGRTDIAGIGPLLLSVLLSQPDGTMAPPASYPAAGQVSYVMATADMDRDGDLDLVTGANSLGTISVYRNDGGTFASKTDYSLGASSLAIGDIDRDGDIDVIASSSGSSTVSILLNDGTGHLAVANS